MPVRPGTLGTHIGGSPSADRSTVDHCSSSTGPLCDWTGVKRVLLTCCARSFSFNDRRSTTATEENFSAGFAYLA